VVNKKKWQAVNGDGRPNAPPVNLRKKQHLNWAKVEIREHYRNCFKIKRALNEISSFNVIKIRFQLAYINTCTKMSWIFKMKMTVIKPEDFLHILPVRRGLLDLLHRNKWFRRITIKTCLYVNKS
jgi:hypothetical protein